MNILKKIYNFIYNNFLFFIITIFIIYFIYYYYSFKIIEPLSKEDDKEASEQTEIRYTIMENL